MKNREVEKVKKEIVEAVGPLTKVRLSKILLSLNVETPEQKQAIVAAVEMALRCNHCAGAGVLWNDKPTNKPHKVRRAVNGSVLYSHECEYCAGTGIFTTVVCMSCGVTEELQWDKKNTKHCLKCYQTLERKGYV